MQYIAFDSHKRYTVASVEKKEGGILKEARINHERGAIHGFLSQFDPGSPVAVETIGNWYWIVDEIEKAGMIPQLVHARKAKLMMGMTNKTDTLDARGMNRLQRNGTLPTVWIPPAEIRDKRDLPRTRMMFSRERTRIKNRIHAALSKYAVPLPEVSDLFGVSAREIMKESLDMLPVYTRYSIERLLEELESAEKQIGLLEDRMREAFGETPELKLVDSLPGVGFILGTVIMLETGDISRFATAERFTSYCGTTPRVHSSGGKTRFGQLRSDVNHYLKWAFAEAANGTCINRRRWPDKHVSHLYARISHKKGHPKAIGAVARHLAEAAYWMLKKKEVYRDPSLKIDTVSSTQG